MFSEPTVTESWDKRFYGVYRGVVVDSKDPESKGRVRLQVPQILGNAVTNWAWPISGSVLNSKTPYGIFTNNSTESITSTATAYVVGHDTTEDTGGGVYRDLNTNGQRIYVSETGDYQILFSPQFSNSTSSSVQADVWLRINGTDVPRSNSRVTLQGNPNEIVTTIPFIADLNSGDYIEIAWRADHTTVTIKPFTGLTSPTRPDIPAVITTVSLIGNYRPNPSTGVWVMFEGGDPNFPLWMGAF